MSSESPQASSLAEKELKQQQSSETTNKLALAQKKLKVLKNALKQERAERGTVEMELEAAQKNIEQLKNQINDKVRN